MPRVRLPVIAAAAAAAAGGNSSSSNPSADAASGGEFLEFEWVGWADEPRHELLFENAYARVYRARFDARAACETLFHKHDADTVYACVSDESGGVVLNTEVELDAGGAPVAVRPPERVSFKAGLCFCHLNRTRGPRIHRIQTAASNTGTLEFIGAEVLARPPVVAPAPLTAVHDSPFYAVELCDHPRARCYRVRVPAGARTGPKEWGFSGVVMVLTGAPHADAFASRGALKAGSVFWFDGPVVVDVAAAAAEGTSSGDGQPGAELLVVEWC